MFFQIENKTEYNLKEFLANQQTVSSLSFPSQQILSSVKNGIRFGYSPQHSSISLVCSPMNSHISLGTKFVGLLFPSKINVKIFNTNVQSKLYYMEK
jgi:hypothetical protein